MVQRKKISRTPDEWRLSAVAAVLEGLKKDGRYAESIVHHRYLPPCEPVLAAPDPPLPGPLNEALARLGIRGLYTHQVEALEAVRRGSNVLVSTPTASGKTLIYNLPVLETCLADPSTRALYLFPLKALEQDQRRKFEELAAAAGLETTLRAEIYDGDTSAHRRKKILADPPNVILTNPDMLHLGILAYHEKWEDIFRHLRYVVVDELHTYKGIFGAHFASVLRRLRRICTHYGSAPVFIASSATIANPGEFAARLFSLPFEVVEKSGAPSSGRHFMFVNPQELKPSTLAGRFLEEFVGAGLKTIVFTKSRKATELIHAWVLRGNRDLAGRVSSYRSGYLPSERREIEQALASDRLDAVISTSALEMGIDIGGLDACILVGYPGTVASTWQRGGRVGRSGRESAIMLLAQQDALDQYFMRHPEDFFRRSCERALVDPDNEFVLADHLECAAGELPLSPEEPVFAGENTARVIETLKKRGRLLEDMQGRLVASRLRPHAEVNLRQTGESFSIRESSDSGRAVVVGTIGGGRALAECHPGAIYLHRARQYVVESVDLEKHNVLVRPSNDPFYTQVLLEKETEILETLKSKPSGNFLIRYGRLKVTEKITGYQKRSLPKQEILSAHPLELPPQVFETLGFWIEVPPAIEYALEAAAGHFMGGLHAIEHAAISLFPLFVLSDRNDIGGICFTNHPQVGGPAIFIYDGYPGGVGIAYGGYQNIESLLEATESLIRECPCESGCPSCVHSPKCGSGNKPLDKPSALLVLDILLARRPLPALPESAPAVETPRESETPAQPGGALFPPDRKIYVFDLETQRSAEEVGGWGNKRLMRISCAVVQDMATGELLTFTEDGAVQLIQLLSEADLVVGFNIIDFDYQVLSAYGPMNPSAWQTFDILADLHHKLGHRVSLGELAMSTLGSGKSADGLEAIRWFKEGKIEKIIEYCSMDVALTARLFEYGLTRKFLMFQHRTAGTVRLNLDWDLARLLVRKS